MTYSQRLHCKHDTEVTEKCEIWKPRSTLLAEKSVNYGSAVISCSLVATEFVPFIGNSGKYSSSSSSSSSTLFAKYKQI